LLLLDIMPVATYDIDAIPFRSIIGPEELKPYREIVAQTLNLPADWINEYFYQFIHCLPSSYSDRLKRFYRGKNLQCFVMHPTDIAIMKLFAHRDKDESHLRYLLGKGHADGEFVDTYLNEMADQNHPGAREALATFNRLIDALGL
jgi:hypothetical protein